MESGASFQFHRFSDVEVKKPKKKSEKKGPFYFFMQERKEEWMAEGRWDPSFTMRDLAAACKPHWALLSTNPDLLEPYFKKANEFNRTEREGRLDCIGRPLKDLEMEISRIEKKWVDMEREISDTVRNTSPKQLKRKVFYVAHFNHLSEIRGEFPPCEASVVSFSLEGGILNTWQEFVSPLDSVPVGHRFVIMKRARETHCLTQDSTVYREDMGGILDEILALLRDNKAERDSVLPPLYVGKDDLEAAEFITEFIMKRAGRKVDLRIFPIAKLTQELNNLADIYQAERMMERDDYSHYPGLGCYLHEKLERGQFCSLSICKRQVFTLLTDTARSRNFKLLAEKHYPQYAQAEAGVMDVDIDELRLAYDERINRMIPTPAGTVVYSPAMEGEEEGGQESRFSKEIMRLRREIDEAEVRQERARGAAGHTREEQVAKKK